MARSSYKVVSIKLVDSNINETGYEKYEVLLIWKDKFGQTREVKDVVLVNPNSIVYGNTTKPLNIKYPASHRFFVNNDIFSTLGHDVDAKIMICTAKALLKFIYPVDGKKYISQIF